MIATRIRTGRPRPLGILAAALLLAVGTLVAGGSGLGGLSTSRGPGDAAAVPPRAPGGVAVTPGSGSGVPIPGAGTALPPAGSVEQLDHNIDAWRANLEANPQDFLSAANVALLLQGRGRLTGDLADYAGAREAVSVALAIAPDHAPARALAASIHLSLHDVSAAWAVADALVRDDPLHLGALAARADAAMALGDLAAAADDLARLAAAAPGPAVDVRRARLAYLSGDLDAAIALARSARALAAGAGSRDLGFYEAALGEYARLSGDPVAARAAFEAALAIRAGDLGARIGLARVAAFEGDLDVAIAELEAVIVAAPLPEAIALLGDMSAARATDPSRSAVERAADTAAAGAAFATVRATALRSPLAGTVYGHELLRFELDHPHPGSDLEATLAQVRAAVTGPTDSEGRDLVAWALYRLGRHDEAWKESLAARAPGATDARSLFHAGAIALARGDGTVAVDLLDRALGLGPALDPVERAEAESLLGVASD